MGPSAGGSDLDVLVFTFGFRASDAGAVDSGVGEPVGGVSSVCVAVAVFGDTGAVVGGALSSPQPARRVKAAVKSTDQCNKADVVATRGLFIGSA